MWCQSHMGAQNPAFVPGSHTHLCAYSGNLLVSALGLGTGLDHAARTARILEPVSSEVEWLSMELALFPLCSRAVNMTKRILRYKN